MLICFDMRTAVGCGAQTVDEAIFCEHCGQTLRFALLLHDAGTLVGRYRVRRKIGYSGFGAIYEAQSTSGEQVALKESFDASSIKTFAREFAVLSQLSHTNLPRYIEMFEAEGNGYLVMEYVPGQSLQDILDSQAELLPSSQVLGYGLQLCDVLAYLHAQQPPIFHRDIKPANIRLTLEGRIKLVDFGLLKQGGQQTRATLRGLGTLGYAPVEQYSENQQATTPRSDVYALAATLYHLLSGKAPPSVFNRLTHSNKNQALPPLPAKLSPHLKNAIVKGMSVMPNARFADMQTFKQALQGTQLADKQVETSVTSKDVRQKVRDIPVVEPTSPLNRANPWLTRLPNKGKPSYVMPSSAKDLPYLPLLANHSVFELAFCFNEHQQTLIGMTSAGGIYQWRVPDGKLLKILSLAIPSGKSIKAITSSPTFDTVATTSNDYIIRVWNTENGRLLHKLRDHGGEVTALAYAPTGDVLASGGSDAICLWHIATGTLQKKIVCPKPIYDLAFSPDGSHLVGDHSSCSYVWRLADNTLLHTFKHRHTRRNSIKWVGNRLLYAQEQTVVLQDAITGQIVDRFKYQGGIYKTGIALHPNGQQVAVGNSDGQISIFISGQSDPIYLCKAHERPVFSLAYTPDSRFLASGGRNGTVRLWVLDSANIPTITSSYQDSPKIIKSPPLNHEGHSFGKSKEYLEQFAHLKKQSNYVAATHELDLPHSVYAGEGMIYIVGYRKNGKRLLMITNRGLFQRWDLKKNKPLKKNTLVEKSRVTCIAISPDGNTIATSEKDFTVYIWRIKDGKLLHRLHGHKNEIKLLTYTPDGKILASSESQDNTIYFWSVADGTLLRTLKAKEEITCLKFSPDGAYLACTSFLHIYIWSMKEKKWSKKINQGSSFGPNMSWSPDGKLLVVGRDKQVHVIRIVDGQEMICFRGHTKRVTAVAWHPNGQFVLSASDDTTIRVWSPIAPHLRYVAEAHNKGVRSIAISPDGHTFASGSEDRTARLWYLDNKLEESLGYKSNRKGLTNIPSFSGLEVPIQEHPVSEPPPISEEKSTASFSEAEEPSSIFDKLSRWITKQLSD